jgi:hypothetical protein
MMKLESRIIAQQLMKALSPLHLIQDRRQVAGLDQPEVKESAIDDQQHSCPGTSREDEAGRGPNSARSEAFVRRLLGITGRIGMQAGH